MKLPRWLVIAMLTTSVLSVLATAGWFAWWWVTWPERTATRFVELIAAKRVDEANQMTRIAFDPTRTPKLKIQRYDWWKTLKLECQSRTLVEVLRGSQAFRFGKEGFKFKFTVRSGEVMPDESELTILMERQGGLVIGPEKIRFVTPETNEVDLVFFLKGGGVGRLNLPETVGQFARMMQWPEEGDR